ncbi:MAG: bifunctional aspartate kinase/homoserine dehydrogenase I [Bacteroidales bacterium]
MKVLKFGGTSVGSADSIRTVVEIIRGQGEPLVAVFSAFSGITNMLTECLELASAKNDQYLSVSDEIEKRHVAMATELLAPERALNVIEEIKVLKARLKDILGGISNIGEITLRSTDLVLGFGEQMSIQIIYAIMTENFVNVRHIDARNLIFTKLVNGVERVEAEATEKAIREKLSPDNAITITSGYISSSIQGYPTTLGRGGSDFTASLIAAALNADTLEIWTDVSGIFTADPSYTEGAYPIPELSYAEVLELSHFGAKVIYPPTIQPVMKKRIPVLVKNTFARADNGTRISDTPSGNGNVLKAVSAIDKICLVSLTGSGMVGVVGIAARMFTALARNNINVILITQASSEQSICIAIDQMSGKKAGEILNDEFEFEIQTGRVRQSLLEDGYSIVAMVGEGMKYSVGISGQAFSALGKNGINIHAIAQGSSELNISVVVKTRDCHKAVNAIHQEFLLSTNKIINLFIVGTGNVGTAFVRQILSQSAFFIREYQTDFRILGLANSRKMLIGNNSIREEDWKDTMMSSDRATNLEEFIDEMARLNLPNSIFIDNTANAAVSELYEGILSKSISIVTCNKIAASSPYDNFLRLKKMAVGRRVHFRFESNVAAGLPVIQTIDNMVKTGDQLSKIEAVLSGSLNFIFNSYCNGMRFSDAVLKAMSEGYTEPDPLIDLRGDDVSRKLLILVREAGIKIEASDIEFESYLPHPLPEVFVTGMFGDQMRSYDEYFEKVRAETIERNARLRVIARYENGKADIYLKEVEASHPFFYLEGNDNVVSIYSKRYPDQPLIIKGAGAGADVTAAGIFADILSIINN